MNCKSVRRALHWDRRTPRLRLRCTSSNRYCSRKETLPQDTKLEQMLWSPSRHYAPRSPCLATGNGPCRQSPDGIARCDSAGTHAAPTPADRSALYPQDTTRRVAASNANAVSLPSLGWIRPRRPASVLIQGMDCPHRPEACHLRTGLGTSPLAPVEQSPSMPGSFLSSCR